MSRNQLIGKYAKESNGTSPSTVQAGAIAGAVCRWKAREGVFITEKMWVLLFWQQFLLVQGACRRSIMIQNMYDHCVRSENEHRVWRVIISLNDVVYHIKDIFRMAR